MSRRKTQSKADQGVIRKRFFKLMREYVFLWQIFPGSYLIRLLPFTDRAVTSSQSRKAISKRL